jgi:hypothetical protein
VLAVNPLEQMTVLTRTVSLDAFGLSSGEDFAGIVGVFRVERGYVSTTRYPDRGWTKKCSDPVRLTVIAPAGTPAAAIEGISKVPGQGEILLGRGLRYTIVGSEYDGGLEMWRATIAIVLEGGAGE